MKIGIIIHSKTGNTYSVALKLKEKLLAAGHSVNIERITPASADEIRFETLPEFVSAVLTQIS